MCVCVVCVFVCVCVCDLTQTCDLIHLFGHTGMSVYIGGKYIRIYIRKSRLVYSYTQHFYASPRETEQGGVEPYEAIYAACTGMKRYMLYAPPLVL